eukprot:SAG31_NODE_7212_length_1753_cov_2.867594_1_plen_506_part_00
MISRVKAESEGWGRGPQHDHQRAQWYSTKAPASRFAVYESQQLKDGFRQLGYATLQQREDGQPARVATSKASAVVSLGGVMCPVVPPQGVTSNKMARFSDGEEAADSCSAAIPASAASMKPEPPKQPRTQKAHRPSVRKSKYMTARQAGAQAVLEHAAVCKTMDVVMKALMTAGGDGKFSDSKRQPLYLFKKLDKDRSGALDHAELVAGLKRVAQDGGELVNTKHVELFVQAIDANNDGQIVFAEFMDGLLRFKADNARQMLRAASYRFGGQDWKKLFVDYDKDRSGSLEYPEFERLVRTAAKCGVTVIDDGALRQLFRLIDGDGSGTIGFDEFQQYLQNDMLALAGGTTLHGKSVLNNALRRIATAIETSGATQTGFFDRLDADGDGRLTLTELERCVCELSDNGKGTRLTAEEAAAIVALCDADGDSTVDRGEFLAALKAATAMARTGANDEAVVWHERIPTPRHKKISSQHERAGRKLRPSAGANGFYTSVQFKSDDLQFQL